VKKPKPKKVEIINCSPVNGKVGAIATPWEADVEAWLANGWQRKIPGDDK